MKVYLACAITRAMASMKTESDASKSVRDDTPTPLLLTSEQVDDGNNNTENEGPFTLFSIPLCHVITMMLALQ